MTRVKTRVKHVSWPCGSPCGFTSTHLDIVHSRWRGWDRTRRWRRSKRLRILMMMMMMMMMMMSLSRRPCYHTPGRLRLQKDQLHLFAFQHLSGNTLRSCPRHQSLLTFNQSEANPVIRWLRLGDCTTDSMDLSRGRCWKWMEMSQLLLEIQMIQAKTLNLQSVCFAVNIPTCAQGCLWLHIACFALECPGPKPWLLRLPLIPLPLSSILVCYYGPDSRCLRVARIYHVTNLFPILTQQTPKTTSRVFMPHPWQIQNAKWAQISCNHTSTLHSSSKKTQEHRIVS